MRGWATEVEVRGGDETPDVPSSEVELWDEVAALLALGAGEVVVTSGNFLVAAESRLRGSAEVWEGGEHGSH